jgi:hypothetical protein
LLLIYLGRINELADRPEFYNLLTNSCTINIVRYANASAARNSLPLIGAVLAARAPSSYPHAGNRASTRRTCVACHSRTPRGVRMRRLLRAAAMPLRLVTPFARSALITGASFRSSLVGARLASLAGGTLSRRSDTVLRHDFRPA